MKELKTSVNQDQLAQISALCRQRHCSVDQFLQAAIRTELRIVMGNAPYGETKGDKSPITQNVTNTTTLNLFSNNTLSALNNVRLFLWPTGGSLSDWARALVFYAAGILTVVLYAMNNR